MSRESLVHCPVYSYNPASLLKVQYRLSMHRLTPQRLRHLLREDSFVEMEYFDVSYNEIRDLGVRYLGATAMPELRQMSVAYNRISWRGVGDLLEVSWPRLLCLNLSNTVVIVADGNQIGDRGVLLLGRIALPQLQEIYLNDAGVGCQGLRNLSKANWPHLQVLKLYRNSVGLEGTGYLVQLGSRGVKELALGCSEVGSAEAMGLVVMPGMTESELNLSKCPVLDALGLVFQGLVV